MKEKAFWAPSGNIRAASRAGFAHLEKELARKLPSALCIEDLGRNQG